MMPQLTAVVAQEPADEVSAASRELAQHLEAQASAIAPPSDDGVGVDDRIVEALLPVEEVSRASTPSDHPRSSAKGERPLADIWLKPDREFPETPNNPSFRIDDSDDSAKVTDAEAMPTGDSASGITPQMPSPTQDLLQSIRIGWRDLAAETARNIQRLSQATVEQALEMGKQLSLLQRDLKRKEYSTFLSVLGWASAKARKLINLAKTFADFEPSKLLGVELTTLLSLCSKRYQAVVAQLREVQDISQQLVEQLIKEHRAPRKTKQEPISGWKQTRSGGGRYYNVLLHSEAAGLSIEQQAQESGILPQRVIEEAVALRAQQKSSDLVQVSRYYAAQMEELPVVVENARELDRENRHLELELTKRERVIADLEAKLSERALLPQELSSEDLTGLNVGQELEPIQESEQELSEHPHSRSDGLEIQVAIQATQTADYQVETTQATHDLEDAPENDLLASVPQKHLVEEAATITIPQDAAASEAIEDFNATTVPQSSDSEPVESGCTTTTATHDAVASEQVQPATSQPEASDDASAASLQPLAADWHLLQQVRDAEGSLREIDTQIQQLNSKLAQPGSNVVERELRPVLKKQLDLRSLKVSQIVALIDASKIPVYYFEQLGIGRVVLAPEHASDLLRHAQSWAEVMLVVAGERSQLINAVKEWRLEQRQILVPLLSAYLETEPSALEHIDWIPKTLLEKSLSKLSFKIRKIGGPNNLIDEPKFEYIPCSFVSLEYPGTKREQWIFRGNDNKLYPVFGRDDLEIEKF